MFAGKYGICFVDTTVNLFAVSNLTMSSTAKPRYLLNHFVHQQMVWYRMSNDSTMGRVISVNGKYHQYQIILMSLSISDQYTWLCGGKFMRRIPGWPEWSFFNTRYLRVAEMTRHPPLKQQAWISNRYCITSLEIFH